MSSSRIIPPLIPLPDNSQTVADDDKDDLFATLFSPPTPRASPTLPPSNAPPARYHTRTESVDSEFGSFVSVPSTDDPLRASSSVSGVHPFTPLQNFEFSDRLADPAKTATKKNERGLWMSYYNMKMTHSTG
ncbi:hypothetical protein B0H21DRAFT_823619 [Amylocystis lapponica]|nr:hypothetical protein B0H21DRAFT_823619 [Amylocystis lapponica]